MSIVTVCASIKCSLSISIASEELKLKVHHSFSFHTSHVNIRRRFRQRQRRRETKTIFNQLELSTSQWWVCLMCHFEWLWLASSSVEENERTLFFTLYFSKNINVTMLSLTFPHTIRVEGENRFEMWKHIHLITISFQFQTPYTIYPFHRTGQHIYLINFQFPNGSFDKFSFTEIIWHSFIHSGRTPI